MTSQDNAKTMKTGNPRQSFLILPAPRSGDFTSPNGPLVCPKNSNRLGPRQDFHFGILRRCECTPHSFVLECPIPLDVIPVRVARERVDRVQARINTEDEGRPMVRRESSLNISGLNGLTAPQQ